MLRYSPLSKGPEGVPRETEGLHRYPFPLTFCQSLAQVGGFHAKVRERVYLICR